MGWGNESLWAWSRSHDQDDCQGNESLFVGSRSHDHEVLRPSTPTFDYLPWQIKHSI